MKVSVKQGDVLAEKADVLICSANIYLNLSGGVGGEILRRHGDAMQRALHAYLRERSLHFVQRGEVVATDGFQTGFKHVLHAVAVDAWYQSSAEVVEAVLREAFTLAEKLGAKSAAAVALATGYGRLKMTDFARGLRAAAARPHSALELVKVVLHKDEEAEVVRQVMESDEPQVSA